MSANVQTTFRQHCVNIAMLGNDVETTCSQSCVNMWQCCSQHWGPTLRPHSGNVVWMLCPTLRTDVATMFRHQCVNVGAHYWGPMLKQLSGNIVWTLSQPWCPSLYLVGLGAEWVTFKFEFSTYLQHQHASLHWHNRIYKHLSNAIYYCSWVNGQMMNFQISSMNPHSTV